MPAQREFFCFFLRTFGCVKDTRGRTSLLDVEALVMMMGKVAYLMIQIMSGMKRKRITQRRRFLNRQNELYCRPSSVSSLSLRRHLHLYCYYVWCISLSSPLIFGCLYMLFQARALGVFLFCLLVSCTTCNYSDVRRPFWGQRASLHRQQFDSSSKVKQAADLMTKKSSEDLNVFLLTRSNGK